MSLVLILFSLLAVSTAVQGVKFHQITWNGPSMGQETLTTSSNDVNGFNVSWLSNYKKFTIQGAFQFDNQGYAALLKAGDEQQYFFVVLKLNGVTEPVTLHMISELDSSLPNIRNAANSYLTFFGTECQKGVFLKSKQSFSAGTPTEPLSEILTSTVPQIQGMLDASFKNKVILSVDVQSKFHDGKMTLIVNFMDSSHTEITYSS